MAPSKKPTMDKKEQMRKIMNVLRRPALEDEVVIGDPTKFQPLSVSDYMAATRICDELTTQEIVDRLSSGVKSRKELKELIFVEQFLSLLPENEKTQIKDMFKNNEPIENIANLAVTLQAQKITQEQVARIEKDVQKIVYREKRDEMRTRLATWYPLRAVVKPAIAATIALSTMITSVVGLGFFNYYLRIQNAVLPNNSVLITEAVKKEDLDSKVNNLAKNLPVANKNVGIVPKEVDVNPKDGRDTLQEIVSNVSIYEKNNHSKIIPSKAVFKVKMLNELKQKYSAITIDVDREVLKIYSCVSSSADAVKIFKKNLTDEYSQFIQTYADSRDANIEDILSATFYMNNSVKKNARPGIIIWLNDMIKQTQGKKICPDLVYVLAQVLNKEARCFDTASNSVVYLGHFIKEGEVDKTGALKLLDECTRMGSDSQKARANYTLGKIAFNESNFTEGIKYFEASLQVTSQNIDLAPWAAEAYLALGKCYKNIKQYSLANKAFSVVTDKFSRNQIFADEAKREKLGWPRIQRFKDYLHSLFN